MFLHHIQRSGEAMLGDAVPEILHLFAFRPPWTAHLASFTEGVMRGESELAPGQREMIAALTSSVNDCHF